VYNLELDLKSGALVPNLLLLSTGVSDRPTLPSISALLTGLLDVSLTDATLIYYRASELVCISCNSTQICEKILGIAIELV
jgi:hypothetical protein